MTRRPIHCTCAECRDRRDRRLLMIVVGGFLAAICISAWMGR